jgi:biopolymer transport protein ExbB/TolQ
MRRRLMFGISMACIYLLASGISMAQIPSEAGLKDGDTKEVISGARLQESSTTAASGSTVALSGTVPGSSARKEEKEKGQISGVNHTLVPRLMSYMEWGVEWVLWLLFALGLGVIGVFVERLVYFNRFGGRVGEIRTSLLTFLSEGRVDDAYQHFRQERNIPAQVLAEVLHRRQLAPEAVQELVEARVIEERHHLERGLNYLGSVGSNAPFIGLFGTVLGIIKAFHDLSIAEQAGPSVVMAGISEALVATAIGLLVAIPAVVIFNVFKARTKTVISNTESLCKLFLSRQLDLVFNPARSSSKRGPGKEVDNG